METRHLVVLLAIFVISVFLVPIMIRPARQIDGFADMPSDVADQLKPIRLQDFYNATAKPKNTVVAMHEERFDGALTAAQTQPTAPTKEPTAPTQPTAPTKEPTNNSSLVCPPGENVPKDQCVALKDTMTKQEVLDLIARLRRQHDATKPDMSKYILKTQLPVCPPKPDMSKYILRTEVPKCTPCPDMSKYIPKTELKCPPKDCVCPACKDKTTLSTSLKGMTGGLEVDLGDSGGDVVIEGAGKQYTIRPSRIVLERS
jgi:hypothetical protein